MIWSNKFFLSLGLFFCFSVTAAAQGRPICKLIPTQPEVISWIPDIPSYFGKVSPDGIYAYYIGSGNHMLKLEEKEIPLRNREIPGGIDPVPCPDGKILTIPGLSLYEVSDLLIEGDKARPILEDYSHMGVYQSCAVLSTEGPITKYRIITDMDGEVAFRDYLVNYSTHPARAKALGEVEKRCPGQDIKTLLISKTGKYVSGYTYDTRTTRIFDIEGTDTCKPVLDLGFPTGKVEFNFDDTRITFHLDYFSSQAGSYFSGVSSDIVKDVFTLDIKRQGEKLVASHFRRLSTSTEKGSGSYYPSFSKAGKVVFINDDHNFYSFQVVDPESVSSYDFLLPPPGGWPGGTPPEGTPADWELQLHGAAVLGSLWAKQCSEFESDLSAADAATLLPSIPYENCKKFANQEWSPEVAQSLSQSPRFARDTRFKPELVKRLTSAQLESMCKKTGPPPLPPKEYGIKIPPDVDGARLVHHYCMGCHVQGGGLPALDFDHDKWIVKAALSRIELPEDQGRMPPAGFEPPSDGVDHKQIVKEYLECKLSQFDFAEDDINRVYCDGDYDDWKKGDH